MNIDMDAVIDELRKGWRKGGLGPWKKPHGSVCLLGAVARVTQPTDLAACAEGSPFPPIIREQFPERISCSADSWDEITSFNDSPLTTLDDVILVCEKARAEQ